MRARAFLLAIALGSVLAGGSAAAQSGSDRATARLRLDGTPFRPEIALNAATRSRGLMNRVPAPADGMLFVFPHPTSGGFWMKNTHVPLVITFFDRDGKRVKRMLMTPCHSDPCTIYDPGRTYRFALEMRPSDRRPAKVLGPRAALRRLVARAS
jgi:uncharacterized membrane protein (UPF0127 family)